MLPSSGLETWIKGITFLTAGDDDGDGIPDHLDNDDDGDGIPDNQDNDDDGDGIPDTDEGESLIRSLKARIFM